MKEMAKIIHNNYDKISDICMQLSKDYQLRFTVELNKRYNDNVYNFHKEFGYNIGDEYRVNILRDFIYYLSIESLKKSLDGRKHVIRIGINDIYFLKYKLQNVISWFMSDQYKSLFAKNNDKIIMIGKPRPIKVTVSFGAYILFEPSIYTDENGNQVIGVMIYLNSDYVSFFMSVDRLLSFNYFISTFNMYQSAQLMLNYLSRPKNGTNYIEYTNKKPPEGFFERTKADKT